MKKIKERRVYMYIYHYSYFYFLFSLLFTSSIEVTHFFHTFFSSSSLFNGYCWNVTFLMKATLTGSSTAFPLTPLTLLPIVSSSLIILLLTLAAKFPLDIDAVRMFMSSLALRNCTGVGFNGLGLTARRLWNRGRGQGIQGGLLVGGSFWSRGRGFRVACWLVAVCRVRGFRVGCCLVVVICGVKGGGRGFRVSCWLVSVCGVGGLRVGCCLVVVCGVEGGGRGFRVGCWLVAVCGVKGVGFTEVVSPIGKDSLSHYRLSSWSKYAGVLQLLHVHNGPGNRCRYLPHRFAKEFHQYFHALLTLSQLSQLAGDVDQPRIH